MDVSPWCYKWNEYGMGWVGNLWVVWGVKQIMNNAYESFLDLMGKIITFCLDLIVTTLHNGVLLLLPPLAFSPN